MANPGDLNWQNQSSSNSNNRYGTSGTLASRGLYTGVAPPRVSQAQGIQGTDERAYTRNVQGNELVQQQMQGLMNRGGAYMQNAARRGLETANRRGLLNSSIAAGASERSALEAAMPIAAADAATYSRAQTENLDALNRGLMQERDIMNAQTLEGMRQATSANNAALQAELAREGMALDLQRQRENLAFSGEMQGLDRAQQQWMAQFGLGADLTRAQVGTQLQDWFSTREGQRDMINQMSMSEFNMGLGIMGRFYNNFSDIFFDDPGFFSDPVVSQAVMGFGQTFRQPFMSIFNQYYGGGG